MKKTNIFLFAATTLLVFSACKKDSAHQLTLSQPVSDNTNEPTSSQARAIYTGFPENFENGSKTAYAVADVALSTGSWNLNDALLGTSASDRKNGLKSVRIENTGIVTMNFDVTSGCSEIDILHGAYGTDASSTWGLWYSTNGGSTWTQTGSNVTTSSTALSTATFTMNLNGSVRFQLRKLSGGRLNIDDISITDNTSTAPTRDDNMGMGNPSGATTATSNANNYLMVKTQYALSYNNSKGSANWVSWHLSSAWLQQRRQHSNFFNDKHYAPGSHLE